jgi:hypothetical protein
MQTVESVTGWKCYSPCTKWITLNKLRPMVVLTDWTWTVGFGASRSRVALVSCAATYIYHLTIVSYAYSSYLLQRQSTKTFFGFSRQVWLAVAVPRLKCCVVKTYVTSETGYTANRLQSILYSREKGENWELSLRTLDSISLGENWELSLGAQDWIIISIIIISLRHQKFGVINLRAWPIFWCLVVVSMASNAVYQIKAVCTNVQDPPLKY